MRYKIDYGYGVAVLYTPRTDWKDRFMLLASDCFGIRKSLGEITLLSKEDIAPKFLLVGEYERLCHNGDLIVWDEAGKKIKSEWDEGDE